MKVRSAYLCVAVLLTACASGGNIGGGGANEGGNGAGGLGGGGSNLGGSFGAGGLGGAGGAQGCATDTFEGDQVPLDLVVMLDRSSSMSAAAGTSTVWQLVSGALTQFIQSPGSAGLGVGLQYFPLPEGPCLPCGQGCPSGLCMQGCCGSFTGDSCIGEGQLCPGGGQCSAGQCVTSGAFATCNEDNYQPFAVPLAPLPANEPALAASLAAQAPAGLAPTGPALSGVVIAAKQWGATHPDHQVAVVLATDGVPSECAPLAPSEVAQFAAIGTGGGILTFVIGIGDLAALDTISAAGGTQQAFIVQPNGNAAQQFVDAMNAIRGQLLSCVFDIPEPQMGILDYGKVNVEYTADGAQPVALFKVANLADCDPVAGGWYYNDDQAPTTIVTCPATCNQLQSQAGSVSIVLGCQTIIK